MSATRTTVITGANGGIGRTLCQCFRQSGWHVVATDIHTESQADCDQYLEVDLRRLAADLQYREASLARFKTALTNSGRLDALINNAAVQVVAPIERLSAQEWLETCGVNIIAPFLLVQGLLEELETAGGAVINIGSIHAEQTKPRFSAYATSKAALVGLTRSLAVELGGRVRVSAVCPAAIATPMLEAGFTQDPEGLARLADCHPSRSIGLPEDVAKTVLMLASSPSKYMTGVIVNIDGGVSSRLFDPS